MRVFIKQLVEPPPSAAAVATGIAAAPGGQAGATALVARKNIVTIVAPGNGVSLTVVLGNAQRLWNAGSNVLTIYPLQGTAFLGSGANVPTTLGMGDTGEWTFDGMSTWYASP